MDEMHSALSSFGFGQKVFVAERGDTFVRFRFPQARGDVRGVHRVVAQSDGFLSALLFRP